MGKGVFVQARDAWEPVVTEQERRGQTPPGPPEVVGGWTIWAVQSQEAGVLSQGWQADQSPRGASLLIYESPRLSPLKRAGRRIVFLFSG